MSDFEASLVLFGIVLIAGFGGGMGFAFAIRRKITVKIDTRIRDMKRAMDGYLEEEATRKEGDHETRRSGTGGAPRARSDRGRIPGRGTDRDGA